MNLNRVNICNVKIDNIRMADVLSKAESFFTDGKPHYIVTPNVDHIIKLQEDVEFQKIYKTADLTIADGMPLLWAANFLGTPLKEKISGSDLFPELCLWCAQKGYKVFFLGGPPGAAKKAAEVLQYEIPALKIAGCYSPPFGFHKKADQNHKTIETVKAAKPDVLFVGLGAPKQEKWIAEHLEVLNIPLAIGIGVSFEFKAGFVKRAPIWMQNIGFEWLWRLLMEPKKLWKRYLIDDMKFITFVLQQKYRKRSSFPEKY